MPDEPGDAACRNFREEMAASRPSLPALFTLFFGDIAQHYASPRLIGRTSMLLIAELGAESLAFDIDNEIRHTASCFCSILHISFIKFLFIYILSWDCLIFHDDLAGARATPLHKCESRWDDYDASSDLISDGLSRFRFLYWYWFDIIVPPSRFLCARDYCRVLGLSWSRLAIDLHLISLAACHLSYNVFITLIYIYFRQLKLTRWLWFIVLKIINSRRY